MLLLLVVVVMGLLHAVVAQSCMRHRWMKQMSMRLNGPLHSSRSGRWMLMLMLLMMTKVEWMMTDVASAAATVRMMTLNQRWVMMMMMGTDDTTTAAGKLVGIEDILDAEFDDWFAAAVGGVGGGGVAAINCCCCCSGHCRTAGYQRCRGIINKKKTGNFRL